MDRGKSVTMQSFIPLLLDGKKTPERLDPFGNKARKIEDYVLGYGDDVYFNRGYLGGKLEQGHQYLLTLEIKSSVEDTQIVGDICDRDRESSYDSATSDGALFYGSALNDGVVGTSYKTIQAKFTADRDTTVSDCFWIVAAQECTLSIRAISLKEV